MFQSLNVKAAGFEFGDSGEWSSFSTQETCEYEGYFWHKFAKRVVNDGVISATLDSNEKCWNFPSTSYLQSTYTSSSACLDAGFRWHYRFNSQGGSYCSYIDYWDDTEPCYLEISGVTKEKLKTTDPVYSNSRLAVDCRTEQEAADYVWSKIISTTSVPVFILPEYRYDLDIGTHNLSGDLIYSTIRPFLYPNQPDKTGTTYSYSYFGTTYYRYGVDNDFYSIFAFKDITYSDDAVEPEEPVSPFTCPNPDEIESFYESVYENGLSQIVDDAHVQFSDQPVLEVLELQWPSSGDVPEFVFDMNFKPFNFGSFDLEPPPIIYGFIRLALLITAGFTCRFIIFGA